jgi:hypothetical protein
MYLGVLLGKDELIVSLQDMASAISLLVPWGAKHPHNSPRAMLIGFFSFVLLFSSPSNYLAYMNTLLYVLFFPKLEE